MIRIDTQQKSITIPRGDSGAVAVELTVTDGEGQPMSIMGKAIFAICKATSSSYTTMKTKVVDVVDNVVPLAFVNSDTEGIPPGSYFWDIRILTEPETDDKGDTVETDDVGEVHSVFAMDGMPKFTVLGVAVDV